MVETRCIETTMPDGSVVLEDCIEVSDAELYSEQIDQESNAAIHKIKAAYDNWDTLSSRVKREVIKEALCCLLALMRGRL